MEVIWPSLSVRSTSAKVANYLFFFLSFDEILESPLKLVNECVASVRWQKVKYSIFLSRQSKPTVVDPSQKSLLSTNRSSYQRHHPLLVF